MRKGSTRCQKTFNKKTKTQGQNQPLGELSEFRSCCPKFSCFINLLDSRQPLHLQLFELKKFCSFTQYSTLNENIVHACCFNCSFRYHKYRVLSTGAHYTICVEGYRYYQQSCAIRSKVKNLVFLEGGFQRSVVPLSLTKNVFAVKEQHELAY